MLNWFRKKRLSPQEELERVLLDGFKNLKHSISLREPLKRRVAVTSALGALITTIKGYYPNTAIEEDGMAMSILHDCGSPAQWDDVEEVLDSLAQQLAAPFPGRANRLMVMYYLLAPRKIEGFMK